MRGCKSSKGCGSHGGSAKKECEVKCKEIKIIKKIKE